MKLLPSAIALGAGLLLAGAAFSASLTEADIERMLNQIDQAAQNHDAEGVGRHLAPQVKITIDMSAVAPQMPTQRLGKAEYLAQLREGWTQVQHYSYQRGNTRITIAPGGQSASASATVRESLKMQGQMLTSVSDETTLVELIKGQPLATEVRATVRSMR